MIKQCCSKYGLVDHFSPYFGRGSAEVDLDLLLLPLLKGNILVKMSKLLLAGGSLSGGDSAVPFLQAVFSIPCKDVIDQSCPSWVAR
jgi:hypothetical protein